MSGLFSRAISLFTDSRLPIYYPFNLARWHSLRKRMDKVELGSRPALDVLFTVDVEDDYIEEGDEQRRKADCVIPFLKKVNGFFAEQGIRATLFVQGNLVCRAAEDIHSLGNDHEIALHGHAHELWGSSWFVKNSPPPPEERKDNLTKSLRAFANAGLPRPLSFRAPRMILDDTSFGLLKAACFSIDSSFPSYAGGAPVLAMREGVAEVPVSFDPRPAFRRSLAARYAMFNTHNIATGAFTDGIVAAAMRLAKVQALSGQRPFIVSYSHDWEFFRPPEWADPAKYGFSSEKNFGVLADALGALRKAFSLRFMTMQEFVRSRNAIS